MKLFVALAAAASLSAVAAHSAVPDRPSDPTPLIRESLGDVLRDAGSAEIRITRGPRRASFAITDTSGLEGWAVCATVNAKNAYGAYAGREQWVFLIRDGGVGHWPEADGGIFADSVSAECAKTADAPAGR